MEDRGEGREEESRGVGEKNVQHMPTQAIKMRRIYILIYLYKYIFNM